MSAVNPPGGGPPPDQVPPEAPPLSEEKMPTPAEISFASSIVGFPLKTAEDLKSVKGIIDTFIRDISTSVQHDMDKLKEAIKKMREDEDN